VRVIRLLDQWIEDTRVGPVLVCVEVVEDTETGCLLAGRSVSLCSPATCRHARQG
jgi:hypothetical protein